MIHRGVWVSFVGMDGAGKTSISRAVKKILEHRGFRVALIYGGRGKANVLPVGLLRRKQERKKSLSYDVPHGHKEYLHIGLRGRGRQLRARIIVWVFFIDQLLKYMVQVSPLRRTYDVVLLDRDATDILLIADVPITLKRSLYRLIPRPSNIFYLYHDVETLSNRKTRHPVADFQRQQLLFDTILPLFDPIMIKSEDLNRTADSIASNIISGKYI